MKHLVLVRDLRMRRVFPFVFATAILLAVTSTQATEATCDLNKCMSICRSEYGSGCAGMCGRIISLCKQLVPKPERTRSARRNYSHRLHGHLKLDSQARSSLGRID